MIDRGITVAAVDVLRQGTGLLKLVDDAAYSRRLRVAYNASIGGHYRHCLDHFQSVLNGIEHDKVDYDHRERDRRIEEDREFAAQETRRILQTFDIVLPSLINRQIVVRSKSAYGENEPALAVSTFGREAMYAVAHAIHHYALIGVMCGMMGIQLPADFGVAPSTIKNRDLAA